MVPSNILSKFNEYKNIIGIIGEEVDSTLKNYCVEKKFLYCSRYKTIDSLSEKIESGRYKSWNEVDDLFACSIIIPTLDLENQVIEDVKKLFSFEDKDIKKRGNTLKPPDVFRFDLTRIYAKLKYYGEEMPKHKVIFEIQIKSAFEYAWTVTTHSLTYKTKKLDWKRLRLTAQLKAMVEQMDMLILGFDVSSKFIDPSFVPELKSKIYICDFINKLRNKIIPDELYPKDLNRFSNNLFNLLKSSKWYFKINKRKIHNDIQEIILIIENELNELIKLSKSNSLPKTFSLFQLCFALLVKADVLKPPLYKFYPLITPELIQFFPKVKKFEEKFKY